MELQTIPDNFICGVINKFKIYVKFFAFINESF